MDNGLKDIFVYIWDMNLKAAQVLLSIILFGMMCAIGAALVFIEIPESNEKILINFLGIVEGAFLASVQWFFGSSKGSSDKNDIIQRDLNVTDKAGRVE